MSPWVWGGVLLVAAWAAHWGAERMVEPLKKVRKQWGLTSSAGAALLAIVTASPEVGINVTSAITGVSDIGLGNMLGSNIISIPLMVTIAYYASRKKLSAEKGNGKKLSAHDNHLQEKLLLLDKRSVTVLALPYLAILALVGVLTLPAPWRGLQPINGWIMFAAYLVFLGQAVARGRKEGKKVSWSKKEIWLAVAGAGTIAVGAYFIVKATENLVAAWGISQVIGGLFITGTVTTAPEVFKTWSVVRSGQVSAGTTSVIADNAVTMTIAFLPLALVGTPIEDYQLYWVNLLFVAIMPALYAAFTHWGSDEHGFQRWQVWAFDAAYGIYILTILFWVLDVL